MLARSSTIRHNGSGVALQTPLLVPSFSSKGFARAKDDDQSEIEKILTASGEFLTEAYLISAYDIHYGHVPGPMELPFTPEIIFLDSGGYEISTDRGSTSVLDSLSAPGDWDLQSWESVVSSWPDELPMVAISYDHHGERAPFDKQVLLARQRFRVCREHLHSLLIKPETESQFTLSAALQAARADAGQLGGFDMGIIYESAET